MKEYLKKKTELYQQHEHMHKQNHTNHMKKKTERSEKKTFFSIGAVSVAFYY